MAQNRTSEILAYFIGMPEKKHKVEAYIRLAKRLSHIAHRDASPWTWRYLQSVQTGTVEPSQKFVCAVDELALRGLQDKPAPFPKWVRRIKRKIAKMAKKTRQDLGIQKGK